MKILVLNPNMTAAITDCLMEAGRAVAARGTELIAATAPRGFPYISSRAESQIAGAIALDMLAERHGSYDAAIIAAFGDPGLFAARELFDVPVIGMSEAAMLAACMLGRRFGIVTFSHSLEPWYRECVEMHGLEGRLAGIRCAKGPFASIEGVKEEKDAELIALAQRSVEQDGADVVILAGAPLTGLATKVQAEVPVPLVDQMAAAVKLAEALMALAPRAASAGTFRRPAPKPTSGLFPALAARFEHRDGG